MPLERITDAVVRRIRREPSRTQKDTSGETAELAERANEIFDRVIRPQVDVEDEAQKYVAIDTESEDFEIDADQRAASDASNAIRKPGGVSSFAASAVPTLITSGVDCGRKTWNEGQRCKVHSRTMPFAFSLRPG